MIKQEMAERVEKQVNMIESLLQDKSSLQAKIQELIAEQKDEASYLQK
jgi:hypothetical protein